MDRNCKEYEHDFTYNLQEYQNYKLMLEFSDGIFHDFKNILSNISGLTQLSLLKTESQELETNLNNIYKATIEFRDALTWYHGLMKGNLKTRRVPVQLNGIISRALEMVQFKFSDNKINNIKLVINVHSNIKVLCNSYRLYQAFLNIIMNGIDAMEDMGGILSISSSYSDDFICVKISDTGCGIAEENFNKIFRQQFTTKEHGSGLGLRITKSTIEDHGGDISIKSIKDKGTEVNIYLPIYKSEDD